MGRTHWAAGLQPPRSFPSPPVVRGPNHYRRELARLAQVRRETLAKLSYELQLAVAQINLAIAARGLG